MNELNGVNVRYSKAWHAWIAGNGKIEIPESYSQLSSHEAAEQAERWLEYWWEETGLKQ